MRNKAPYIAIFQVAPLNTTTTIHFRSERDFTEHFAQHEDIRWGTLLNNENGQIIISYKRQDSEIICGKKPPIGEYIESIDEERTVDLVRLISGKIIGIDHEQVCLYANDDEMEYDYDENNYGRIDLMTDKNVLWSADEGISYSVDSIKTFNISPSYKPEEAIVADLIYLKNGHVLLVDDKSVTLYAGDSIRNSEPISDAGRLDLTAEPYNRPSNT